MHTFDSGLSADQCALLEEHGLRFDWRNLSDFVYYNLYEKVGDLIIRKDINERGDDENGWGRGFMTSSMRSMTPILMSFSRMCPTAR